MPATSSLRSYVKIQDDMRHVNHLLSQLGCPWSKYVCSTLEYFFMTAAIVTDTLFTTFWYQEKTYLHLLSDAQGRLGVLFPFMAWRSECIMIWIVSQLPATLRFCFMRTPLCQAYSHEYLFEDVQSHWIVRRHCGGPKVVVINTRSFHTCVLDNMHSELWMSNISKTNPTLGHTLTRL